MTTRRLVLVFASLLLTASAAAQPTVFHRDIRDMQRNVRASLDLDSSRMVILRADSQELRLRSIYFQVLAREYTQYIDSASTSHFEVGFTGPNFSFGFKQKTFFFGLLVTLGFVLLGGISLLLRYKRRAQRLHEEQARIAERRRLVEQGREQERLRLAQDLHDGPLQALYALRMQLARRTLDMTAHDRAIEQIADHLRGTATSLRAPMLTPYGLSVALRELAATYPSVSVSLVVDEEIEGRLEQYARTALFRVAQEGLSNAVRHGGASDVLIQIEASDDEVCMIVQDNGSGFDTRTSLKSYGTSGHYGLIGMHERIEVLGGRIRIESNPSGTRLEATIPILRELTFAHQGDGASSIPEAHFLP
ncbi:MAG TPA: sensor histidine kinase [Rhodothermales bacterium]|nr:sensor histidine kinase [Rhodothermales bacterium]